MEKKSRVKQFRVDFLPFEVPFLAWREGERGLHERAKKAYASTSCLYLTYLVLNQAALHQGWEKGKATRANVSSCA